MKTTVDRLSRAEPQRINRVAYERVAPHWDEARCGFGPRERDYLEAVLGGVPQCSLILDAGCGSGRPIAEHLASQGHRLVGVDQSEGMLKKARQRVPDATWINAALEDYAFTGRYQAVVCWDTLFHIERQLHERILAAMADCLVPGGRLMLTVGGSEGPPFTDTMFGETFFYDSHPPHKVLQMLNGLGFDVLMSEYTHVADGARNRGRYAVLAQRADTFPGRSRRR
jgi:2-polyprenyl-3-methyl-5-hydroxy-6-metoxy-1,4-benzoquinol methylase